MRKLVVLLLSSVFLVSNVFAADLAKARQEGKANFYANITALEPIMEAYTK